MQIVLYQPRIPPNTGSIARLCAATRTTLNLIQPLGFSLEDKYLKRAGLDYWSHVHIRLWKNWEEFLEKLGCYNRLIMTSARKGTSYVNHSFQQRDCVVFGPETWGLPEKILTQGHGIIRIPILGPVRSLNLSTAAAVILYEALRQNNALN